MDAELQEMDKRFKILQQNFYDSKSSFTNNFDKKSSLASLLNNDMNEVIFDLVEKKEITIKLDFFIQNSSYLQSYIVFIPDNDYEKFAENYEKVNVNYVMPRSLTELCRVYGHVVVHVVALQMSEDEIVKVYKE